MSGYNLKIGERKVPIDYSRQQITDGVHNYLEHEIIVRETNTRYVGCDLQELIEEITDDITGVLV